MASELSHNIEIVPLSEGNRYVLPPRSLGVLRNVGWVLLLVGLALIASSIVPLWPAITDYTRDQTFDPGNIFNALFALPSLIGGVFSLSWGRRFIHGRNEITILSDRVIVVGRPSIRRGKRVIQFDNIERLAVSTTQDLPLPESLKHLGALTIESHLPAKVLAWGYPVEMLRDLAYLLADEIAQADPATFGDEPIPVITKSITQKDGEVDDGSIARPPSNLNKPQADPSEKIPKQPTRSKAVVDDRGRDGLTITLPATGLSKSTLSLFVFSLFWLGFMAVFTTIFLINGTQAGSLQFSLMFGGFSLIFWAIGFVMLGYAINASRRHAIIDVIGDTLLINRKSLFGLKQNEWNADQISAIRVGPSGMEVNNKPVMNLHIVQSGGNTTKLFTARDDKELYWLAALIRHHLRANL